MIYHNKNIKKKNNNTKLRKRIYLQKTRIFENWKHCEKFVKLQNWIQNWILYDISQTAS